MAHKKRHSFKKILLLPLLGLGVLVGLSYINTGKKLLNLTMDVANFKFGKISFTNMELIFDFNIQNFDASDVTLNSLAVQLFHDGKALGNFIIKQPYNIAGNQEITTLKNIKVTLKNAEALNIIAAKLLNSKYQINVQIVGTLTADNNPISFDITKAVM